MFGIGATEMVVIGIVLLIAVGPSRLPKLLKGAVQAYREFRRATRELRASTGLDEILQDPDLKELRKPLNLDPTPGKKGAKAAPSGAAAAAAAAGQRGGRRQRAASAGAGAAASRKRGHSRSRAASSGAAPRGAASRGAAPSRAGNRNGKQPIGATGTTATPSRQRGEKQYGVG